MFRKTLKIKNASGEDINLDLRHREDAREAPAIVILHGFKGFKDWGFFPSISERLAESGYVTITPNFSRNGIGFDHNKFDQLDKFADNTYSHELQDIESILQHIKEGKIARKVIDIERIGILGHSRGGGLSVIAAKEWNSDIQCLVTWASVSTFFRYSDEQINAWQKNRFIEIENSRTKQMMRVNKVLWDDLNKNKKRLDILSAAEEIEAPALFIHGSDDKSVSCNESELLHAKCGAYVKRLELIEETNHTFGIRHPMEKVTEPYETVCEITENWFDNYLNI